MKLTHIIATATTAAVLGTAGISIAGATTSGSTSTSAKPGVSAAKPADGKHSVRRTRLRRIVIRRAVAVAADTIGIPAKDLVKELRDGKTVAEVATAHNVAPQRVIDAIVKAATEKIEAAKTAGRITAERAAKLEARLPALAARFVNEWHPRTR
jgi:hypothetical protein